MGLENPLENTGGTRLEWTLSGKGVVVSSHVGAGTHACTIRISEKRERALGYEGRGFTYCNKWEELGPTGE